MRSRVVQGFLGIVLLIAIVYALFVIFQLGQGRFFDVDEMAYLHWAHDIFIGRKPYTDFLYYATPLFPVLISFLYHAASGLSVFYLGRGVAFLIFILTAGAAGWLFWEVWRSYLYALLAALTILSLPIPLDRFIEVRPDTLAMFFLLLSFGVQVRWLRTQKRTLLFWCGLWASLSILTLQKNLPAVLVAALLLLTWTNTRGVFRQLFLKKGNFVRSLIRWPFLRYIGGFAIPVVILFFWTGGIYSLDTVIYGMVRLPLEIGNSRAIIAPGPPIDFYFRQNDVFFGNSGPTYGYYANRFIWLMGGIGVGIALVFLVRKQVTQKKSVLLLILAAFVQTVFFVYIFPSKFIQYLIPLGIYVALFSSYAFRTAIDYCGNLRPSVKPGHLLIAIIPVVVLVSALRDAELPKLGWTNQIFQLQLTKTAFDLVPPGTPVLDLQGDMVYYPNPYYICCMPYGEFAPYVSRPLPDLAKTLEETRTKYIYQGGTYRINALPAQDREYVLNHYHPTVTDVLYEANDW